MENEVKRSGKKNEKNGRKKLKTGRGRNKKICRKKKPKESGVKNIILVKTKGVWWLIYKLISRGLY